MYPEITFYQNKVFLRKSSTHDINIPMILHFLLSTLIAGFMGAVVVWLLIQPVVFISHRMEEVGIPRGAALFTRFAAAAYVGSGWTAWMVVRVLRFINKDGNTEPVVYYILGGIFTVAAMYGLFIGERQKIVSVAAMLFVGVAYLLFCLDSSLLMDAFGWFVSWYYGKVMAIS